MIFHFFIKQNSRKGCRYSRWTYFFTTPPDIPIRLELKDYIIGSILFPVNTLFSKTPLIFVLSDEESCCFMYESTLK
jgi:hypothetical protein